MGLSRPVVVKNKGSSPYHDNQVMIIRAGIRIIPACVFSLVGRVCHEMSVNKKEQKRQLFYFYELTGDMLYTSGRGTVVKAGSNILTRVITRYYDYEIHHRL